MSYGLYVGRNHTRDGHAWLGGYGDEPSSHWLEVEPRRQHPAGATITVGVTPQADMPGVLTQIPQVAETARLIRVSYSYYLGIPAPLTNGGLNEHGVAVRDIWSPSRQELKDMTPRDQKGPNYSDLARIVVERARTAREGVELIGALIGEHGYSTYGGNSHFIADPDEAWVVIEYAGGRSLWAAERVGPDDIRASRPGYIGVVPVDRPGHPGFLYPAHLTETAREMGWWQPGTPFDVNAVYGDGKLRWEGVAWIEDEMRARAARPQKIGLEDMMWAVRTEKLTGDTAGYGQVVPLVHPRHAALRMLWHTQIGAVAAPFVPVFMGVTEVPEEYRQHRYLTADEDWRFIDRRHAGQNDGRTLSAVPQGIEGTRSANAVFKRLLYLIGRHHEAFLPEITTLWQAVEARLDTAQQRAAHAAEVLLDAGEDELAGDLLTYFTRTELLGALALAETQAASLEARTRALHGISTDRTPRGPDQLW
jgi:dipeptidase